MRGPGNNHSTSKSAAPYLLPHRPYCSQQPLGTSNPVLWLCVVSALGRCLSGNHCTVSSKSQKMALPVPHKLSTSAWGHMDSSSRRKKNKQGKI